MSEDEQRAGLGQMAADDGRRVSLLEQFMPIFDTRSQHAIEVHAPAQAVFTAVEAVTVKEVRFLRELEFIRALPGLVATGRLDMPTLDAPLLLSFTRGAVLLGGRPPVEVLAGAIGRFWRLAGNEPVAFSSREGFRTFSEPGFAKAVVAFRLDRRGSGILLTTETRFVATDETTHRLMSRYWRIIRTAALAFGISIGTLIVSAGVAYIDRTSVASVYTAALIALISAWTIVASLIFSLPTVQNLALGASLAIGGFAVVGLTGHGVSVERATRSARDATSEREGRLAAAA